MKKILLSSIVILLVFNFNNVNAQSSKQKKKKNNKEVAKKNEKKDGIQPFEKIIKKTAISDKGLFTTHKVDDDQYYEIPDSLFGREMLMVTRISKTATGIGFGGGKQNTQVLRWERKDF